MKKIIFIILVLFSFIMNINAKEIYYSEYSEFSDYSISKMPQSDLIIEDTQRRYKWYQEEIDGAYLKYGEGVKKYNYVDLNNYQNSKFNDYQEQMPDFIDGRIIEQKNIYKVQKAKPIRYIHFYGFDFMKDKISLGQIEIYANGRKVNYELLCGDCDDNFDLFNKRGYMMIDMTDLYYLQDITININSSDINYINSFTMIATSPSIKEGIEDIYFEYNFQGVNADYISITNKNWIVCHPNYEEELEYDHLPTTITNLDKIEKTTLYRYQDPVYYFYNINKRYADDYYFDYPKYLKDQNNYLDFYRYKHRDKIEIADEIKITDYNQKLDDFILSTTDYKIDTDINYLVNGKYKVKYNTDFITVTKEVKVDIKENELNIQLNKANEKYDNLMNDYNNNKNELVNANLLYEELLNKYQKLTSDTKECSNSLITIQEKNIDNEKKLKLSNQANDYLESSLLKINNDSEAAFQYQGLIPFICFLLLIVLIIYFLKKLSKKN